MAFVSSRNILIYFSKFLIFVGLSEIMPSFLLCFQVVLLCRIQFVADTARIVVLLGVES